jgi:hypothetical protein
MLKQRAQTTETKLEHHKELPLHICKLPLSQSTLPPELMQQCNTGMQQRAKFCSPCPGRLDRLHRAVRPPTTHLTARGAVRTPLHQTAQKLSKPIRTPSKHSQVSKIGTNLSPLLTMHESSQKCKKCNLELLK